MEIIDDCEGGTSSEYAILVALIAIAIIGVLVILGLLLVRLFEFDFPMPF